MSDQLRRLLGSPHTAWLLERVRRRLEHGRPVDGTATLAAATPEQRRAIELLLGRRPAKGASLSVSLDEVDSVLRSSGAAPGGLRAAVETLTGPVTDRVAQAAEDSAAWRAAYAELDRFLSDRQELAEWRTWLDSTGLVRRIACDPRQARLLLDNLTRVLRRLPSTGTPIGRLAAEACGDAHALDEGKALGTLSLSAARAMAGMPESATATADARRRIWAAVGVHLDDLSSTVLCLGLPGDPHSPAGRILQAATAASEPVVLTLRQLRRQERPIEVDGLVRLCENPVVVAAAADDLGSDCPPLVCVNGRPSTAVWRLLELLQAGGGSFAYHGDFDWGGIGIATAIYERVGWTPWMYDTAAYEAACHAGSAELDKKSVPTPWDPSLSSAMVRRGVRVEEELVLDLLIEDLGSDDNSCRS